jgi:hypothetical protein
MIPVNRNKKERTIMTSTKITWINGYAFRIPADELTDPHGDKPSGGCGAYDEGSGATCTLAPHETNAATGTVHIAHNGYDNVIAIWGPIAVLTDADTEEG